MIEVYDALQMAARLALRKRGNEWKKLAEVHTASPDHAPRMRFFCASGERTRADVPSGGIGVRTLAVRRVRG